MTRIDGVGGTRGAAQPRGARRAAGDTFAVRDDEAVRAGAVAGAAGVGAAGILAVQEQAGGAAADREARQHGQDLLAALSALQRALLAARTDEGAIARLSALLATLPEAADPRLAQVVRAIALRARIELARLEASPPQGGR